MALTSEQFRRLREAVREIPERQKTIDRLRADLAAFVAGGALSERLAEQLRPRIDTLVSGRLDDMQDELDADVAQVRTAIPDYDPTAGV